MTGELFTLSPREVAPTGGAVVTAVCDALDGPISSRAKGMIGKQAVTLLQDGFEFELVVIAAVVALRRGAPQHMSFIADDLARARAGERLTRKEYERMLEDEIELGGSRD